MSDADVGNAERLPHCSYSLDGQCHGGKREDDEQYRRQHQVLKPRREMSSMRNRQHANIIGGWRGQQKFRNQIGFQKFSAKENHRRQENQPSRRDPLHRINNFVIKRRMVDEENGNSRAGIEEEGKPARPAVDRDLIEAQSE